MSDKVTKRQQAVLDCIEACIQEKGYGPTVREICQSLGLSSPSTVHVHLKALEEKGLIKRDPLKSRSITLTHPHDEASVIENVIAPSFGRAVEVPLVGNVAAGSPILAVENIQEYISLPTGLLHGADEEEAFLLQVSGESMILAGINHGDLLVVHRGLKAENGDIVVARVGEDSATVKRIFFEQDAIRLQPENPYMEPIYADYQEVAIVGKVIALLRRY